MTPEQQEARESRRDMEDELREAGREDRPDPGEYKGRGWLSRGVKRSG